MPPFADETDARRNTRIRDRSIHNPMGSDVQRKAAHLRMLSYHLRDETVSAYIDLFDVDSSFSRAGIPIRKDN